MAETVGLGVGPDAANARLLAASPDLLKACLAVSHATGIERAEAVNLCRVAIAKAEPQALDGDEHGGYPDMDATSADERTELLHRELRDAGR